MRESRELWPPPKWFPGSEPKDGAVFIVVSAHLTGLIGQIAQVSRSGKFPPKQRKLGWSTRPKKVFLGTTLMDSRTFTIRKGEI